MSELIIRKIIHNVGKSSQIIISGDRPPMKLDRVQERIKSRLSGGLVVDIDTPDLDLKTKIIRKKLDDIQNQFKENCNISEDVINFIANESKTMKIRKKYITIIIPIDILRLINIF